MNVGQKAPSKFTVMVFTVTPRIIQMRRERGDMNQSAENGHRPMEGEVAEDAFRRMSQMGEGGRDDGGGGFDRSRAPDSGAGKPPYDVEPHPEDPPGALPRSGREICDPEEIREAASWLGKASQAIDPEWFDWVIWPLYRSVHRVREGAVVIPAQRAAGDRLRVSASTEADVSRILADGAADGDKADRLEVEVLPQVDHELEQTAREIDQAESRVQTAQRDVDRLRIEEEERAGEEGRPPHRSPWWSRFRSGRINLFARVSSSPWKVLGVFGAEVGGTAALITTNVADITGQPLELAAVLSVAISIALLAASFTAGAAVAAVRLPGWLVGVGLVGLYAAILTRFVPGLDALREADASGVQALTAATLAAFFIAVGTGYALATRIDLRREIEVEDDAASLAKRAGTQLGDALDRLDQEKEELRAAKQRRDELIQLRVSLRGEIEELRDSAARAEARSQARRRDGVEAEVEEATIRAMADTGVSQEEAAADWASLIASLTYRKTRAEKPPRHGRPEATVAKSSWQRAETDRSDGLSTAQKAALATVGASGLSSLVLGPALLGVGLPLAALIVGVDRWRGRRGGGSAESAEEARERRLIVPASFEGDETYFHQPERTYAKYTNGGSDPTERQ